MSIQDDFDQATSRVKELPSAPSNEDLLNLYGLYKQATDGNVHGKRPGALKLKDRAKYDAWAKREGLSKDEAKQKYVDLVNKLHANA